MWTGPGASTAPAPPGQRPAPWRPASSSIRWPWPASRMAPRMKTEALILALSHAAWGCCAPGRGRIVNISAMAGRVFFRYAEVYAAAKGAAWSASPASCAATSTRAAASFSFAPLAARSCTAGTEFQAAPRARPGGGVSRLAVVAAQSHVTRFGRDWPGLVPMRCAAAGSPARTGSCCAPWSRGERQTQAPAG
jgi:hypothetical protein